MRSLHIFVLCTGMIGTTVVKLTKHLWEMVDLYNHERTITSMAKTTALPSLIIAKLIATKKITETRVIPIDSLIIRDRFQPFLNELKRLGIDIDYTEEVFV